MKRHYLGPITQDESDREQAMIAVCLRRYPALAFLLAAYARESYILPRERPS